MNELFSLVLFRINESISRRIVYKTFDIINTSMDITMSLLIFGLNIKLKEKLAQ